MVLFLNVCIGQFVEVRHRGQIVCGTIRYKGFLNGVKGDWIGVELEYPLGSHNGCWRGRQYFKCPTDCGLFTHASNVRFRRKARQLFDTYHKKPLDGSYVKDGLNTPCESNLRPSEFNTCYSIDKRFLHRAQSAFEGCDMFGKEERYPLCQSVSRSIVPATARTTMKHSTSNPIHRELFCDSNDFGSLNASIPHYTMPHEMQRRHVQYLRTNPSLKQPRFLSV